MIEFRKISNSKVAPLSGSKPQANKPRKLFPRWPKRGRNKRHVYNAKRRRGADMLHANRSGYLFISGLGLLFISGGSALTWYGTVSEVKDLLLIGPGSIVIGFLFILVGVVFVARMMYYKWYIAREAFGFDQATSPETAPAPSGVVLYREQEMASIQHVILPPTSSNSLETTAANIEYYKPGDEALERTFQVTNDTHLAVNTTDAMESSQCSEDTNQNSAEKPCYDNDTHNNITSNNKQHSRPDSGYEGVM